MMNKQQAYNSFWSGFGVLAFEENSVPDDDVIAEMVKDGLAASKYPYITYQVLIDDIDGSIYPSASIFDKATSWERSDLLCNLISERIQNMGTIPLDNGGRMFITKGSPFAQHMFEDGDISIKRILLNLGVEFFTEY